MKNKITVLVALCWGLVLPMLTAQINLNNGLVAHYPFNNNANDISGNGHHGTVHGATLTTDRLGHQNRAYNFDGIDDYIDIGNTVGNGIRSISLWFSPSVTYDSTYPDHAHATLIARNDGSQNKEFGITINQQFPYNSAIAFSRAENDGIHKIAQSNSNIWNQYQWYHVIGIIDSITGMSLYINGVKQSSTHSSTIATHIAPEITTIGTWGDALTRFFNGKIDDIRIYNRAITPAEVQALYQEGINLNNGLVAHYPFNNNANDVSGNGHHGTEYGGLVYGMDRFGNWNSAGVFDGIDDYIDIGNTVGNGVRTISLWFSPNITYNSTDPTHTTLITRNDGISATTEFAFTINQLPLYDGAITFSRGENGIYKVAHSNSNLWNQLTWYHVIGIIDPIDGMSIYINGVKQTSTDPSTIATHTDPEITTIGARGSNLTRFFNGKIDDIRIYNRAITPAEVQTLYQEGTNLNNGLVAHYPFNNNANDVSGNGHHGTVYGATLTTDRFGNQNRAYNFDGIDDYIEILDAPSLNPTTTMTIQAWYKPTTSSSHGNGSIISKGYTAHSTPFYQYHLGFNGNTHSNKPSTFKSWFSNTSLIAATTETVNNFWQLNKWYHIVSTYDGTNIKLYVDGILLYTQPFSGLIGNFGENLIIGGFSNFLDKTPGVIDDIRIYNRALTLAEIQILYNQNSSAPYNYCFGDATGNNIAVGCNATTFTIPLWVDGDMTTGIIGLDFCMAYDPNVMTPTGNAYFGSVVTDSTNGLYLVNANNGEVNVSISNTGFSGTGKIIEVEFTLNAGASLGNYPITHCATDSLIESFATYDVDLPINSSSIEVTHEPMNGRVIYHNDGSQPIINNLTQPTSPTLNIHAIDGQNNCSSLHTVTPDANGYFDLPFPATATGIRLERDIPNSNSVLGAINGADVVATFHNIISNNGNPTVFQLIAADVNNSGRVTSGDLTLMIQRNGTGEFADANDWYFIHDDTLQTPAYLNAHKNAVPIPSVCMDIPDLQNGSSCVSFLGTAVFHAVLKGDVNRTWTTANDAAWRSGELVADSLILELPPMDLGNNRYKIPIRYVSQNSITSFDGRITIDPTLISIDTFYMAPALQQVTQKLFDYSHNGTELVFNTALLNGAMTTPAVIYYLEVTDLTGTWQNNGILCSEAYFNGEPLNAGACTTPTLPVLMESDIRGITIFPNPTTDKVTIDYRLNVEEVDNIELYDVQGQVIKVVQVNDWGTTELFLTGLPSGIYVVKVQMTSGKIVGKKIVLNEE